MNINVLLCSRIYINYRKTHSKLLRNAKKKYYESMFKDASGNPVKTWTIIKGVIGSKYYVLPDEVVTREGL